MINKNQTFQYEILISDTSGKSEIKTFRSLAMALCYSDKLWTNAVLKNTTKESVIQDKKLGINLKIQETSKGSEHFIISLSSTSLAKLDSFRHDLLTHVRKKLGFTNIQLLVDEVSDHVSLSISPLVNQLEVAIRNSLSKFCAEGEGSKWWESKSKKIISGHVKERTSNGLIDLSISLTTKEELRDLLNNTKILDLAFPNKKVLNKWKELNDMHYAGFPSSKDLKDAEKLAKEVTAVISKQVVKPTTSIVKKSTPTAKPKKVVATTKAVKKKTAKVKVVKIKPQAQVKKVTVAKPISVKLNPITEVKEVITPAASVQQVVEKKPQPVKEVSLDAFNIISKEGLVKELKEVESKSSGFVDLQHFVKSDLPKKGYAFGPAYSIARGLDAEGIIEIYDTKDSQGVFVKAIRTR